MPDNLDHAWYRRTLDSLLEGFQVIGFDWTYLYVNPAAAAQGRKTPADLEGRKMWEAYPDIDRTPIFEVLRACMADRRHAALENLFAFPDGSERWFELRIEPVAEGLCIHSFDIEERKTAQRELTRANASLEAMVAERTRELEQLNQELEAFTYSVSHDLRAPLRHVSGFASLLRTHAAHALDEKAQDYVERITAAAKRMGILIDELLGFSRTGRTPLVLHSMNLADLVRDAQRDLPEAATRPVQWTVGTLPVVTADRALMRLVFVNLLSNALKFTRRCSDPRIEVGSQVDDPSGEFVIFVRDNGVGFDQKYADQLFGVFQRLHLSDDFEGTGIGLANVRRIVHKHGGRTWAEGAVDRGATFYFSLPRPGV